MTKKKIRQEFRDGVFERDGHKCVFCEKTDCLDAHHVVDRKIMPNGGYVVENGITLCPEHHELAEVFHITHGQSSTVGMHPSDLFKKIGSSFNIACEKSKELGL